MICELFINKSQDNVLIKKIEKVDTIEIKFIEDFNDNYIIIKNDKNFNYLKIDNAFYFVRNCVVLDNKRKKINIDKDVLMTYKDKIVNFNVRVTQGDKKDLKNFTLTETTKRNYERLDFPNSHFSSSGDIVLSVINTRG